MRLPLAAILLSSAGLSAAVSFESEVKPIFEKHCIECHGPKKQKSDFRLDDREVALHGGESHAPNILPGKAAESPLLKFVTTADRETRMPPKGERLTAAVFHTTNTLNITFNSTLNSTNHCTFDSTLNCRLVCCSRSF